ncbi:MAG TPA: glutathionylspermidine synthase family protein [Polyangiaceae bacterium]|nr:glutathionylspermidine synthase family protein [Polyangiaceae bacterium]
MTTPDHSLVYRCGARLDPRSFAHVRRTLLLDHCKWDPQVGDVSTLADFPLLMPRSTWSKLASLAEALTAEVGEAERELVSRPELLALLGLPRRLRAVLAGCHAAPDNSRTPRALRYDFHYTRDGWRISECNADVPGGYAEASAFTALMAQHYAHVTPAGDPGATWVAAIAHAADGAEVALISAAGFMEDHQVIRYLAKRLRELGLGAHCLQPAQIRWQDGVAFNAERRLGAVVRFYQAEWLTDLPRTTQPQHYFRGARTPVLNPGTCVTVESKRFPLTWEALSSTRLTTWRSLLPECAEPRRVPWRHDDAWLLKSALCNTGDTVSVRSLLSPAAWAKTVRAASWFPGQWVAQKRFEPVPLATPLGSAYPCIGIYTVNGRACGAYARLSLGPIVDYAAIDVALLLEDPPLAALS